MSYGHINTQKATERSQQIPNYCQSNKQALPIFQLKHLLSPNHKYLVSAKASDMHAPSISKHKIGKTNLEYSII